MERLRLRRKPKSFRRELSVLFGATLSASLLNSVATGAERYSGHKAWADYHIASLAPEIQTNILRFRKQCGLPFAATHAFAKPSYPAGELIALHYENLWCNSKGSGFCKGPACLHEVYVKAGSRYRLAFRGYVRDVEITPTGWSITSGNGG